MTVQHCLNFGRVDIESMADDQVFRSSDDEKISIIQPSQITGIEPSFGINSSGCLLGSAIVALHDVRSPHPQLARFTFSYWFAVGADQLYFNTRERWPYGVVAARRLDTRLRDGGRTFRHPIAVVKRHAEKALYCRLGGSMKLSAGGGNDSKRGKPQRLDISELCVL